MAWIKGFKTADEIAFAVIDFSKKINLPNNIGNRQNLLDDLAEARKALNELDPTTLDNLKKTYSELNTLSRPRPISRPISVIEAIQDQVKILDEVTEGIIDGPASTIIRKKVNDVEIIAKNGGSLEYLDNTGKLLTSAEKTNFKKTLVQSLTTIPDDINSVKGWIKRNPILTAITVAGVTFGSIILDAHLRAQEINKKIYNITSIQKDTNTIIVFDSNDNIVPGDILYIMDSDCIPDIDGQKIPLKFNQLGITEIKDNINTNGSKGTLKIKTSSANRAKDTATQITSGIGNVSGGAIGGLFGGIFGGLGDFGTYLSWGAIICCIMSFLLISVILVMKFSDY